MQNKNTTTGNGLHTRRASQYARRAAVFVNRGSKEVVEDLQSLKKAKRKRLAGLLDIWRKYDKRYRYKWRVANGLAAVLILSTVVLPVIQHNMTGRRYKLSQDTLQLVGKHNQALASKLTLNQQAGAYEFNKDAVKEFNPKDPSSMQVGGADDKSKSLYSLDVSVDPKKGVTFYDSNSKLGFKLVPQFNALPARTEQGRIVFPLNNGQQAVYTLKNNGLKEDIIIPASNKEDVLKFSYKLELPKTLEAKPLADGSGGIGIYGGDPTLYNEMSYGSDKDRELVEKAREKAEKTQLLFGIPAPTITTLTGNDKGRATSRFELTENNQILTIVSEHLTSIKGVFSIDPSVVVTSTSDFATNANNEGNIDFDTANQITRGKFIGGETDTWSSTQSLTSSCAVSSTMAAVVNGYVYLVGGADNAGNEVALVCYAQITTTGTIAANSGCGSAWCTTTALSSARSTNGVLAYNGYLYSIGGKLTSNATTNQVVYAKPNSNGTIPSSGSGTWTSAGTGGTLITGIMDAGYTVSNDYFYVIGGCATISGGNCGGISDKVQYAPINADGTLGAWHYTHNGIDDGTTGVSGISTTRKLHSATAYNGYIYVGGGCVNTNCGTATATLEYAKLNSDGTVGSWITSTALPFQLRTHRITAANGYLYLTGGSNPSMFNDTRYAQINANGSIGSWISSANTFATARIGHMTTIYAGYIFIIGGCTAANCAATLTDVQSGKIKPAGANATYTPETTNSVFTRYGTSSVAYNGYLYVTGGCNASCASMAGGSASRDIRRFPLGSDGSIGTGVASTALAAGRYGHITLLYNNRLYIIGGCTVTGTDCTTTTNTILYSDEINTLDGSFSAWNTASNNFTTGRFWHGAAIAGDKLYVAGGCTATASGNCSTYLKDVQWASISTPTGNVNSFSGNTLPNFEATSQGRYKFSMTVWGSKYLYITGGYDQSAGFKNDVLYIAVDSSGGADNSINGGAWSSAGNTFTTARAAHNAIVYNDNLYIAEGCSANITSCTFESGIQYAHINNDGTIGTFTSGSDLGTGRFGAGATVFNGYLYVTAGCTSGNCANPSGSHAITRLNNGGGGDITSWTSTSTITSLTPRTFHRTVAYNGYLYILGGYAPNTGTPYTGANLVVYAPLNANGTVGTWQATNGYSNIIGEISFVAYGGYMYRVGGAGSGSVQSAPVCDGVLSTGGCSAGVIGNLGTWVSQTNLNAGRIRTAIAAYGNRLYMFGGCATVGSSYCTTGFQADATFVVESASITAGGTVGSWSTSATNNMPVASAEHEVVQYMDYVYVLGGCNYYNNGGACNNANGDHTNKSIYVAKLDGSTTLADAGCGTGVKWCTQNALPVIITNTTLHLQVSAYNGFLYIIGGPYTGVTSQYDTAVWRAPIHSNGTLGTWVKVSTGFTTDRKDYGATIYNGYAYITQGCQDESANCFFSTSRIQDDVQYAPIDLISRKGSYSRLIDFGRNTNVSGFAYNGSQNTVSLTYRFAESNGSWGSTNNAANIAKTSYCYGNTKGTNGARFFKAIITFDDTGYATYGTQNESSVTDFTVNFTYIHPPPNIRLKGGKTLQSGELTALDTCDGTPAV